MSNLTMNWVMDPEPASYIFATCNPGLNKAQAMSLLAWVDISGSNSTLLNPLNMKDFFTMVDENKYGEIETRFGLSD